MNQQIGESADENQKELDELQKELDQDRKVRDEAEKIDREEKENIERIEKRIDQLEHHRIELFVNGERKEWDRPAITYQEVVRLLHGTYEEHETVTYSVDYTHGPEGHREGILDPGQSVPVINKMRFRVQKANRS